MFPVLVFQQSKQQNRTWTNLLNRTRNPSEPYSDKEIPIRRALRPVALLVGLSTGNPTKIGTLTLGTVRETVLGHLLIQVTWLRALLCVIATSLRMLRQRRKKRTQPPPKGNLLENFSGLKENFPGRWWIQKPYKKPGKPYPPPKSFLCGPHLFLQRKVLHWSRAVYGFSYELRVRRRGDEAAALETVVRFSLLSHTFGALKNL